MNKGALKHIIREEVKDVLKERGFPGFNSFNGDSLSKNKNIVRDIENIKRSLPNIRDIINLQLQNPELNRDIKKVGKRLMEINNVLDEIIQKVKNDRY